MKSATVAKGIAILLVVLGHCFPSNIFNGQSRLDFVASVIYDFVYSFHMPIFFYISGYLFYNAWHIHRQGTIKNKAFRLLIPYLTFSVIYIPLRIVASSMANSVFMGGYWRILVGISPNGGVWFLYTLFVFFVITFYFVKSKNIKILFTVALGISVISQLGLPMFQLLHSIAPRLLDLCRFYSYFLLGLLIRIYNDSNQIIITKWFMEYEVPKFIVFCMFFILYERLSCNILAVPIALLGVNLTIILSSHLKKVKILSYLGTISMDIYLLHGPLIVILRWIFIKIRLPKLFIAVGLFIISIVMALIISKYIIHKFKIIELLCTGSLKRRELLNEKNTDI